MIAVVTAGTGEDDKIHKCCELVGNAFANEIISRGDSVAILE